MARLISRSDLARTAGVSPAAITKACKGQLAPACDGRRIDLDHPAVADYLACKRGEAPKSDGAPTKAPKRARSSASVPPAAAKQAPERRRAPSTPRPRDAAPEVPERPLRIRVETNSEAIEEEIDKLAQDPIPGLPDRTLRELIQSFGTVVRFRDWLVASKTIEDIREKRLKNLETEGKLIPREPIKVHIFGAIDSAFRRLLQDAPKTMARRLYAAAKSGVPIEDAEATARDILSSILNPVKATAVRVLREGEA